MNSSARVVPTSFLSVFRLAEFRAVGTVLYRLIHDAKAILVESARAPLAFDRAARECFQASALAAPLSAAKAEFLALPNGVGAPPSSPP